MQSLQAGYFVWHPPGLAVAVRIRREVMVWLDEQAKSAFQSVPKRGAETGGVLLGSRGTDVITIESAEEIPCEHREGPSFRLSAQDESSLNTQMGRIRAEGLVVVGFYRSDTRDIKIGPLLTLTLEDRQLLDRWAPRQELVFLMLKPVSLATMMANLFFITDGRVLREPDFSPFPFDGQGAEAIIAKPKAAEPAVPATPRPEWRSRRAARLKDEEAGTRERRRMPVWALSAIVVVLVGLATLYSLRFQPAAPQTAGAPNRVELVADRTGNTLLLRWDPANVSVRNATNGQLLIEDGSVETRYKLDSAQLAGGRMAYVPRSRLVTFSLETHLPSGGSGRGILTYLDPSR
jgi:hypothetical protein